MRTVCLVIMASILGFAAELMATQPNDALAGRIRLELTSQFNGMFYTVFDAFALDATREPEEPAETGQRTVWWTWKAPERGVISIAAAGVFTGDTLESLRPLEPIASGVFEVDEGFDY